MPYDGSVGPVWPKHVDEFTEKHGASGDSTFEALLKTVLWVYTYQLIN
jgi:hypothetical protein